jgi:hypothetical protein
MWSNSPNAHGKSPGSALRDLEINGAMGDTSAAPDPCDRPCR